jgi:transcriptional regulator with XRE-family HTH domain
MVKRIVNRTRQARLAYQARLGRQVALQEVATHLGVTRPYLNNIELNRAWPTQAVLEGLCLLYGVTPGDLLVLEDVASVQTEAEQRSSV